MLRPLMQFQLAKFIAGAFNLALLWLTWQYFVGGLGWGFAAGATAISLFWLGWTGIRMRGLFRTYFDVFSRLQVLLPLLLSVTLSALSLFSETEDWMHWLAGAELLAWAGMYVLYRWNRHNFMRAGRGPLPAGCWINPPMEAIKPGDLILFGGNMAKTLHESVGHGEVVFVDEDGTWCTISSFMERGAAIRKLEAVTRASLKKSHYIVLRLRTPLTAEQLRRAPEVARQMVAENVAWRDAVNARRARWINRLPLFRSWREWLISKTKATGYDWLGLLIGTRAKNRWICVVAGQEFWARLGVEMEPLGSGLLGLGTGLLDPINPVRFLMVKQLRLLTETDREEYEKGQVSPEVL